MINFWLELSIVLLAIIIGARLKGIGLGVVGGIGLAILAFGFHLKPASPPIDVLLIIITVVTAASVFEAAGGLNYLVHAAEKIIRKNPNNITFIAPLITYIFTFFSGTAHVCYAILPAIAEVARGAGVRPERPLTASVTASQQAITASPISAATAIFLGLLQPYNIEFIDILKICVPATIGGSMIAAFIASKMGKDLHKDPKYINKDTFSIKGRNKIERPIQSLQLAKIAIWIFIAGIVGIIFFGTFKEYRPVWHIEGKAITMNMTTIIEIIMLTTAGLITLICKVPSANIVKGKIFLAGIQAVIAIFGVSWLGNTFFKANETFIIASIQTNIIAYPWQFSIFLFILSIIVLSQAAAVCSLMPLGIILGIPIPLLIAMFPAANGLFFIPNHAGILAAINFDSTGTTRIGKYILNHSFMIPGLVATTFSVLLGMGLIKLFY